MTKKDNILQHLADIDFRTRVERQKHAVDDFKSWYDDLSAHQALEYQETIQAQMSLLSSVLWYLMPEKDFKKFMKR